MIPQRLPMNLHGKFSKKGRLFGFAGFRKKSSRLGMSLVEMAVIMIVMGIITVIMLPLMSNMFLAVSDKKQAKQMAAILGLARNMAIGQNKELIFEFDLKADPSEDDAYEGFVLDRSSEKPARVTKIKRTEINLIGVRTLGGSLIDKGKVELHFLPSGVGEQAWVYVGTEPGSPEAIIVLDRYLGKAHVFYNEDEVRRFEDENLKNEGWRHDQN